MTFYWCRLCYAYLRLIILQKTKLQIRYNLFQWLLIFLNNPHTIDKSGSNLCRIVLSKSQKIKFEINTFNVLFVFELKLVSIA